MTLNISILDGWLRGGRGRKKDRRKRKGRLSHTLLMTLRAEIKSLKGIFKTIYDFKGSFMAAQLLH